MTYTKDDEQTIRNYEKEVQAKFGGKETDDIRKEIVGKYKEEEYPKILIVTDMLLAGFNAPSSKSNTLTNP